MLIAFPETHQLCDFTHYTCLFIQRKLMLAHPGSFPVPVHEGSASIWHLADVLTWLQTKGSYTLAGDIMEVAQVALQVNVAKEGQRLSRSALRELEALVD